MAGLYDVADWTELSESHPRNARLDTLQIHHSTTSDRAAARSLYAAGGRQVSPNCQLHDGVLYGICDPLTRRAFTSGAVAADHRSLTVEVDNITLAPDWGIGTANHERLAQLFADMYKLGLVSGLYYGMGGIIGHYDVPGSYATACPGPSLIFGWIINRAKEIYNGKKDDDMSTLINANFPGMPMIADDPQKKQPHHLVWSGTSAVLIDTMAKLVAAQKMHQQEGQRGGVPKDVWDWLVTLIPRPSIGGGGGSVDLTPVLEAIAAGEAQDARDVQSILAAIAQVDEATLRTFGLQRVA